MLKTEDLDDWAFVVDAFIVGDVFCALLMRGAIGVLDVGGVVGRRVHVVWARV